MLDIAVPKYLQEGGTYVITGHGRVGDEADMLDFRDMLLSCATRIAELAAQGKTLAASAAAQARARLRRALRQRGAGVGDFVEAIYARRCKRRAQAAGGHE